MTEWVWVPIEAVLATHDRHLANYGGLEGIRDLNALEGGMAPPRNLTVYGDPDAAARAAAYVVGIAKAHAFLDGNKRTAWATGSAFLWLNGSTLSPDKASAVQLVVDVAAGMSLRKQRRFGSGPESASAIHDSRATLPHTAA